MASTSFFSLILLVYAVSIEFLWATACDLSDVGWGAVFCSHNGTLVPGDECVVSCNLGTASANGQAVVRIRCTVQGLALLTTGSDPTATTLDQVKCTRYCPHLLAGDASPGSVLVEPAECRSAHLRAGMVCNAACHSDRDAGVSVVCQADGTWNVSISEALSCPPSSSPCLSNPCGPHSTCVPKLETSAGYMCKCLPGILGSPSLSGSDCFPPSVKTKDHSIIFKVPSQHDVVFAQAGSFHKRASVMMQQSMSIEAAALSATSGLDELQATEESLQTALNRLRGDSNLQGVSIELVDERLLSLERAFEDISDTQLSLEARVETIASSSSSLFDSKLSLLASDRSELESREADLSKLDTVSLSTLLSSGVQADISAGISTSMSAELSLTAAVSMQSSKSVLLASYDTQQLAEDHVSAFADGALAEISCGVAFKGHYHENGTCVPFIEEELIGAGMVAGGSSKASAAISIGNFRTAGVVGRFLRKIDKLSASSLRVEEGGVYLIQLSVMLTGLAADEAVSLKLSADGNRTLAHVRRRATASGRVSLIMAVAEQMASDAVLHLVASSGGADVGQESSFSLLKLADDAFWARLLIADATPIAYESSASRLNFTSSDGNVQSGSNDVIVPRTGVYACRLLATIENASTSELSMQLVRGSEIVAEAADAGDCMHACTVVLSRTLVLEAGDVLLARIASQTGGSATVVFASLSISETPTPPNSFVLIAEHTQDDVIIDQTAKLVPFWKLLPLNDMAQAHVSPLFSSTDGSIQLPVDGIYLVAVSASIQTKSSGAALHLAAVLDGLVEDGDSFARGLSVSFPQTGLTEDVGFSSIVYLRKESWMSVVVFADDSTSRPTLGPTLWTVQLLHQLAPW